MYLWNALYYMCFWRGKSYVRYPFLVPCVRCDLFPLKKRACDSKVRKPTFKMRNCSPSRIISNWLVNWYIIIFWNMWYMPTEITKVGSEALVHLRIETSRLHVRPRRNRCVVFFGKTLFALLLLCLSPITQEYKWVQANN